MKRKKIVAVLLTAALTATSFLPGTGFAGLEKAFAATTPIELKYDNSTQTEPVNIMEGSEIVVAVTSDPGLTYDSMADKMNEKELLSWVPIEGTINVVPKEIDGKLGFNVTAQKYGDATVTISSGGSVNDSTSAKQSLTVRVKTKAVSVTLGSITNKNKVLSASASYVDQKTGKPVDAKYVSPSTITYTWYKSATKTTDVTGLTAIADANKETYTVTDTTGYYYIVKAENKEIDGTKAVTTVTDEKIAASSSNTNNNNNKSKSSSSVTVAGASNSSKKDDKKDNTTTTTDKKDDTNKTTTTVEKADGSKETTTVEENADGSKVEKVVTENPDGSVTEKIKEVRADGSTFESEKTTKADGSSVEKSVETKADGTTITTEKTTKANGDVTSKVVTKYVSGKTVTEESDIKANGNYVIAKTTVKKSGAVSLIVSKKTGKNEVAVTYSAAKNSKKLTVNKIESNAKTVTLPATVKAAGATYKVTAVKAGAMKNNKVVTKATLGKNITSLGKNACMGASNLKTVNIKGNVTTYGKNCLKNINKKAVVNFTVITKKQAKASAAKLVKTSGIPAGATLKYKNKVIK